MAGYHQFSSSSNKFKVAIAAAFSILVFLGLHVSWQQQHSGSKSGDILDIIHSHEDNDAIDGHFIQGDDHLQQGEDEEQSDSSSGLPIRLPALIAAARGREDVTWMNKLASSYELYPYNVDDRHPTPRLAIPANKGHEAMVYLTYIINNYDDLPPHAVFVHGHEKSWHQEGDIIDLIQGLQVPALQEVGYVPLRCDWYPSCPAELNPVTHESVVWGPGVHRLEVEMVIGEVWGDFFPGVELPMTIASQCCAQFAVTKEAILRRPKEQYERLRDWVLQTPLGNDISGRVLEKLWAYIMTDEPVHCPSPQSCACKYFGRCEKHHWPTPPKGLQMLPEDSLG